MGALSHTKGSSLFWKIHQFSDWLGENPNPSQWKQTWSLSFYLQDHYVEQPFYYFRIAIDVERYHLALVYTSIQQPLVTSIILVFCVGEVVYNYDFGQFKRWTLFFHRIFMKSKLCNQLTRHLDLIVRMFTHDHYISDSFPIEMTIRWSM